MNFGEGDISMMLMPQQFKQPQQPQQQQPVDFGEGDNSMQQMRQLRPEMYQQAFPQQQQQQQRQPVDFGEGDTSMQRLRQFNPQMYQHAFPNIQGANPMMNQPMPNMMQSPFQMPQFNNQEVNGFTNPMAQQMSRMIW